MPPTVLADTRHQSLRCADCHRGFEVGYPHPAGGPVVAPCQTCHAAEGRDWEASVHGRNAEARGDAPTCVGCHGSHTVYGAEDRRSPVHPLNVAGLCGRCHADDRIIGTYFASPAEAQARTAVAQFHKTVHGTALTRAGLTVAATCNDCHRAHLVLPAEAPASSVNRASIPSTCGGCHLGVVEAYDSSAHGQAKEADAPVCTTCHTAHQIVRADAPQWRLDVVEECGTCHERLYQTYFDTYHGKVTRLGYGLTAKCSDCHTAHSMRRASDPASTVHPLNLVATCARCHPAANANFVRYRPHGDPKQRTKYPILFWTWLAMTLLLVGVFSFFGLHTTLWLVRSGLDARRARRTETDGGKP